MKSFYPITKVDFTEFLCKNSEWTIVYLWRCWFHGKIDYQTNLVTNIGVWISIRSVIIAWYISKYQSKHYSNSSIPLLGSLSVKMANYWGLFLGLFRSFFRKFFARHFSRKMFRTAVFRFREKCEKLCSTNYAVATRHCTYFRWH